MQHKTGGKRNLRQIGKELGVAHIVEGSVQRSGNRVRVYAQLIDARTDAHLWAQTYDRDLADVLPLKVKSQKHVPISSRQIFRRARRVPSNGRPQRMSLRLILLSRQKSFFDGVRRSCWASRFAASGRSAQAGFGT